MSDGPRLFTMTESLSLAGFLSECRWTRVELARADHGLAARLAGSMPDRGRVRDQHGPEQVREHVEKIRRRHLGSGWGVDGLGEAEGTAVYDALDVHFEAARRLGVGR